MILLGKHECHTVCNSSVMSCDFGFIRSRFLNKSHAVSFAFNVLKYNEDPNTSLVGSTVFDVP